MYETIPKNSAVASLRRIYFTLVDATDLVTPKDITVTGVKPTLWINGVLDTSGTANTFDADIVKVDGAKGEYYAELSQAESNVGLGVIRGSLQPTGCALTKLQATVGPAESFDSPATSFAVAAGGITSASFGTDAIDANALKADAVTEIATGVWASATRTLSSFGTLVADIWANVSRTLSDKTGFALTSGERTSIANEVEAQIIDETDSEKVLTAITDKIASVNPSLGALTLAAIASAVRDVLNTSPAANSLGAGIKAAADRMPGSGTLPNSTDLATALGTADDAVLAALVTLTGLVDDLEGRLTAARAGYLDNLNPATGVTLSPAGSLAMTESYAADGATATLPQLLYAVKALLSEFSISGTTLTTKKLDGTTTAETFTLNDGTNPTAITRAS